MAAQECKTTQVKVHRCVSVLPNDYAILENKPKINGKELEGNLSVSDIGALSSDLGDYATVEQDGKEKFLIILDGTKAKKMSLNDISYGDAAGAIQAKTRRDLPTLGTKNGVYFVIDENATYRWDDELLQYIPCGRDYTEIRIINCGDAEEF